MKKRFRFALIIFLITGAIACKNKTEHIHPTVEPISEWVYTSGNVKSVNQYQVFSKANGLVQDVLVHEGDLIKANEPILVLTNVTAKLNAENASLNALNSDLQNNREKLNELEVNIELAKKKMQTDSTLFVRQQHLWEKQIGTKVEIELKEIAYLSSKSALMAAQLRYNDLKKQLSLNSQQTKNNLSITETLLEDYSIKSMVDGKVYSILKEKGEMVNTQTPVAIIGDAANFVLVLQADENDIVKIKLGQNVDVVLDSYKGEVFDAKISKINPIMNERTRTFELEAVFTKQPKLLYPNLTAEANILISQKENALTIPRRYLVDNEYVIKSNNEKQKVNVGLKNYEKVEIIDGITKDDELIFIQQ